MSEYSDFDTAVEIMAYKMADYVRKAENDETYKEKLENLRKDRNLMYRGDKATIKKLLQEYGKDIKNVYDNM